MSASALQTLRELYPQRYAHRSEEVAHVLRGQSTRGVVQRVREGDAVRALPIGPQDRRIDPDAA